MKRIIVKVVQDANRIAGYFAGFPREAAIAGVREHIEKFWELSLRDQLIDYVSHGGAGLHELVIEAVKRMAVNG
jgi:formate dehydrogenase subunit delta